MPIPEKSNQDSVLLRNGKTIRNCQASLSLSAAGIDDLVLVRQFCAGPGGAYRVHAIHPAVLALGGGASDSTPVRLDLIAAAESAAASALAEPAAPWPAGRNFNNCVYMGLQTTTATNAVIMLSITPVLIVALSFLLLRQTVSGWQALGIVLSLSGVLVIVGRGDLGSLLEWRVNSGDLWILAAVFSWALYSVCLRWRPAELEPLNFQAATMLIGVVILTPLYG
jgi:hypothetical protein